MLISIYNLIIYNPINQKFFFLMLAIFFMSLYFLLKKKAFSFVDYTPALLTSIGIFGTFLGIFFGLLDFNPKDIDLSIETLLSGLKTAFITSLVGLFLSMIFKIIHTYAEHKNKLQNKGIIEFIKPIDIYNAIEKQSSLIEIQSSNIQKINILLENQNVITEKQFILIEKITQTLASDENSLLSEMKIGHEQARRYFEKNIENMFQFKHELWQQLDNFADILSKSATETIIEALKEVIQDFNNNLTEQFGENFKELNQAVFKLVEWQNLNLAEMKKIIELYEVNSDSLDSIKNSILEVSSSLSSMIIENESLGEVIEVNQHQINNLSGHLEAFSELKDKAVSAIPTIHEHITTILDDLTQGTNKVNESMLLTSNQISESAASMSDNLSQAVGASTTIANEFDKTLTVMQEKCLDALSNSIENFGFSQKQMAETFEANTEVLLNNIQQRTIASLNESKEFADKQMENIRTAFDSVLTEFNSANMNILANAQDTQSKIDTQLEAHAKSILDNIELVVQNQITRTESMISDQIERVNQVLTSQLNTALEELGGALLTIHSHLANVLEEIQQGKNE